MDAFRMLTTDNNLVICSRFANILIKHSSSEYIPLYRSSIETMTRKAAYHV